jgi:hypothetical protein
LTKVQEVFANPGLYYKEQTEFQEFVNTLQVISYVAPEQILNEGVAKYRDSLSDLPALEGDPELS